MRERTGVIQAKRVMGGQQGFTLIELIAVVIILGILSMVLVTRYMNMTDRANDTVAKAAAGEGMSRFNLAFQQYLTNTSAKPTSLSDLSGATYLNTDGSGRTNIGDYDIVYSLNGSTLTVQAYKKGGSTSLASLSAEWP